MCENFCCCADHVESKILKKIGPVKSDIVSLMYDKLLPEKLILSFMRKISNLLKNYLKIFID